MRIIKAIVVSLTLVAGACTSTDDAPKTGEAVAPGEDASPAFSDGTPSDVPPAEKAPEAGAEATPSSSTETMGELTDPNKTGGEPAPETSLPPTDPAYSQGPEIPEQPAMEDAGVEPGVKSRGKGKTKGRKGKGSTKTVVRYVTVAKLNVRSAPSLKASVVRQLDFGTQVEVQPKGKFSKLGEGEWVRTKHLSAQSPTAPKKAKGGGKKAKGGGKKAKAKADPSASSPAE